MARKREQQSSSLMPLQRLACMHPVTAHIAHEQGPSVTDGVWLHRDTVA